MTKIVFAQRLKRLRIESGISQIKVAEQIGVSNTTLSQYESGKRMPCFDVLCALAKLYSVTTDFLLGAEERDETQPLSIAEWSSLGRIKLADENFISAVCAAEKLCEKDLHTLEALVKVYIKDRTA